MCLIITFEVADSGFYGRTAPSLELWINTLLFAAARTSLRALCEAENEVNGDGRQWEGEVKRPHTQETQRGKSG